MMPRVNFMTFLVIHFIFLLSIDFTKFAFFHENFMLALSISRNFYPKNSFVLSYTVHLLVLMICIFIFCFFIPYSFSTFSDFCKNFPKNLNLKRFWRPKNVHHNTITPNSCGQGPKFIFLISYRILSRISQNCFCTFRKGNVLTVAVVQKCERRAFNYFLVDVVCSTLE